MSIFIALDKSINQEKLTSSEEIRVQNLVRYLIIWLAINVTIIASYGQSNGTNDSISHFLKKSDVMTGRDYFQARSAGYRALEMASAGKDTFNIARANQILGVNYWVHARYKDALLKLNTALLIFKKIKDTARVAQIENTIGLLHFYQGDYQNAISYLKLSLEKHKSLNDSSQISRVSNNLGLLYDKVGEFVKSTEYIIQGIKYKVLYTSLRDQSNSDYQESTLHQNKNVIDRLYTDKITELTSALESTDPFQIARSYSELGNLHQLYREYDSAIYNFQKARYGFDSLGYPSLVGLELRDIGQTFNQQEEYDSAIHYLEACLPYLSNSYTMATLEGAIVELGKLRFLQNDFLSARKHFHQARIIADTLNHRASVVKYDRLIGETFLKEKSYLNAERSFLKSYEEASKLGSFRHRNDAAEQLYLVYKSLGNEKKALEFHEEWVKNTRIMNRALAERTSQEFQARYENEVKAVEIKRLSSQKEASERTMAIQRNALIAVIILAGMVVTILFVLYTRFKKINILKSQLGDQNSMLQKQNEENKLLVKEVHHRVKNNLQMVSSIISMQNRRVQDDKTKLILDDTKNRVKSIGLIHEHLYRSQDLTKISLPEYVLELVEMLIKSLHDGNPPTINYKIPRISADMDTSIHLGLILNELIINCIKYAFKDHPDPSLDIEVNERENYLIVCVSDNGLHTKEFKKGFGMSIIGATLDALNGNASYEVDNGFQATITIGDYVVNYN